MLSRPERDHCVKQGSDAAVELIGDKALKRFHTEARFKHELLILQQLPPCCWVVSPLHWDLSTRTLTLPRYGADLLTALGAAEPVVEVPACCNGVIAGVHYCHSFGLVHRDLKLENVLLDWRSSPVLCDFSRSLFAPEPIHAPFGGTLAYAAPEACEGVCWTSNDVWSLGILLFCIIEQRFPFDTTTAEDGGSDSEDLTVLRPRHQCDPPPLLEYSSSVWGGEYETEARRRIQEMLLPDFRRRMRLATGLTDFRRTPSEVTVETEVHHRLVRTTDKVASGSTDVAEKHREHETMLAL